MKYQIYVSLEGVDESKIQSEFKPTFFDVKFHDIQGKNYRCAIPKLHSEIVPEKCKILVKLTRVVITLLKASKGNWQDLHLKEEKLKPNLDKENDPMAGIMDLMKLSLFSRFFKESSDEEREHADEKLMKYQVASKNNDVQLSDFVKASIWVNRGIGFMPFFRALFSRGGVEFWPSSRCLTLTLDASLS
ncbi:hypothetical protein PIB30_008699 [Stylosanthes scabra]|uniref:CS domain-containing protein n=1 Tax=Stylosanthes scabra TaxID=79078 RepID=A0ABU6U3R0_9FABA|nr:hypothetical protein [Stylosanthes scabra]